MKLEEAKQILTENGYIINESVKAGDVFEEFNELITGEKNAKQDKLLYLDVDEYADEVIDYDFANNIILIPLKQQDSDQPRKYLQLKAEIVQ